KTRDRGAGAPRNAREAISGSAAAGSAARIEADFPVLQGCGEWSFRRGDRAAREWGRRPPGPDDWDQMRTRVVSFLQAIRREIRGLRRQEDLPRVCRRGARASRAPDSGISVAGRATAPPPRSPDDQTPPATTDTRALLIDLHLHTTASDGLLEPSALVTRAAECGLRTISVTDHDTCAGLVEANDAARRLGLRLIAGVEITAVEEGRDLHMLAYFVNPESTA